MRKCSKPEKYFYLIMNKPCAYVCAAASDSHKTVYELLTPELQAMVTGAPRGCRLHTVGRLDLDTSGLLLITNDGKFSNKVATSTEIQKTYHATLAKPLASEEQKNYIERAAGGLTLPPEKKFGEQEALPAALIFESPEICEITMQEGKFHEVRRIFRALGNEVITLERIAMGSLMLPQDLSAGQWREMTDEEKNSVSHAELVSASNQ